MQNEQAHGALPVTLGHTLLPDDSPALEHLLREMLRPMIKIWLDDNLPRIVEMLVRAEIDRIAPKS